MNAASGIVYHQDHVIIAPIRARIKYAATNCFAEEDGNGTLDFTEGAPPSVDHPAEEAANFAKRSLIDVEDESIADSDTEEVRSGMV